MHMQMVSFVDDSEWRLCLRDAVPMQTGNQLRQLYATLLLFCSPSSPLNLWTEFKMHICDELRHRIRHNYANFIDGEITDIDIHDYGLF